MAIQLKAARVNANFTQKAAAKELGISKGAIVSYEAYRSKPSVNLAQRLAELYGMKVDDIIWSATG